MSTAAASTPYQTMEEETDCQKCCRKCKKLTAGACCCAVLVVCLVQGVIYWWATLKCNASHLKDYEYPGGGPVNLVPYNSLLVEQAPRWWGSAFINIPSDDVGMATGASTGVYFKTPGPIFNTYTYQDIMSQETFVIRDRPLAIGGSHKVMRCDGTGPTYVISEGSHWIMNNIRELFGMYATRSYNIWQDSTKVALSEKVGGSGQSHKQIIFRAPDQDVPFASCFLKSRHFHGEFDEWFVQEYSNMTSSLPAFVPHAACVLMSFVTSVAKAKEAAAAQPKPGAFLEVPESTVLAGVEAGAAEKAGEAAGAKAEAGAEVEIAAAKEEAGAAEKAGEAAGAKAEAGAEVEIAAAKEEASAAKAEAGDVEAEAKAEAKAEEATGAADAGLPATAVVQEQHL